MCVYIVIRRIVTSVVQLSPQRAYAVAVLSLCPNSFVCVTIDAFATIQLRIQLYAHVEVNMICYLATLAELTSKVDTREVTYEP